MNYLSWFTTIRLPTSPIRTIMRTEEINGVPDKIIPAASNTESQIRDKEISSLVIRSNVNVFFDLRRLFRFRLFMLISYMYDSQSGI